MITEYFSILLRKFKKKSFLQQISSNQISFFRKNPFYNLRNHSCNKPKTTKVKNPFFIVTPIQTTSFLLK
ncbi:hypothetical protein C2R57_07435 [Helicobacter pylori]|nr:hypothetical protein C2R57_07435 [Helicobacter pylori]